MGIILTNENYQKHLVLVEHVPGIVQSLPNRNEHWALILLPFLVPAFLMFFPIQMHVVINLHKDVLAPYPLTDTNVMYQVLQGNEKFWYLDDVL